MAYIFAHGKEFIPHTKSSKSFFGEGLTFDDVLLLPAYSQVLPRDVNINPVSLNLLR